MPATLPAKTKRAKRRASFFPLPAGTEWTVARIDLGKCLTDEELLRFSVKHGDLRIEQTGEGELIIMPPTFGETGNQEVELATDFVIWARAGGGGKVFGPTAGFRLPDNSVFSPDVSWMSREQLAQLPPDGLKRFTPVCPEFVLELRSRSDRLAIVQQKMQRYPDNGARLGWLIDPLEKQVFIYRPGQPVEHLQAPAMLSGKPVLPGFMLDLTRVW